MHKYLKISIATSIGVLAGFYLCILVKKITVLEIDPKVSFEINPFEIFTLITTILLAIYVARTIGKANDLEKGEKDLLNSYLSDFKNEISNKIELMLEQTHFDSVLTNSNFKILRKRIDTIMSLAVEYNFILNSDQDLNELRNKIRDVWELFTNTPRTANGRSSAAVRDDINRLRLEQISKIKMTAIEIEKLLFQLTMKIHKK